MKVCSLQDIIKQLYIYHLKNLIILNTKNHKFLLNNKTGLRRFKNVINIKLLEASIPYVPYNIWNSGNHNKLNFNETIISINEGYYYIKELINEINSKLTNNNISFKYHCNTKNISITNNSNIPINIKPSEYSLFKRLGFHNDINNGNNGTSKLGKVVDLSIPYIDIIYKKITPSNANLTDEHDNLLKRIF